jgi:hypothetical protein
MQATGEHHTHTQVVVYSLFTQPRFAPPPDINTEREPVACGLCELLLVLVLAVCDVCAAQRALFTRGY